MNKGVTTSGRISGVKRFILYTLIFTLFTACFSLALAPQADAASYKVKSWKSDGWYYYTVYTGKLPKNYSADFYRFNSDVYKSGKTKITFYNPCSDVSEAQADAFWRWLGKNSKANKGYAGYIDYYTYFPYIITGWSTSTDSVDALCSKSPYTNSLGTRLYVVFLGSGNQVTPLWSDLVAEGNYAMLMYNSHANATIGLYFEDTNGEPIDPYFAWYAYFEG